MEQRLERIEEAWNTFIVEFPFCPRMVVDGKEDYQRILFLCSSAEKNPAELCFALFGPRILLRQCQTAESWANVPLTRLIFVYAAETPPALKQTLAYYQSRLNTPVLVAQKSNVHKTAQHVIEFLTKVSVQDEAAAAAARTSSAATEAPANDQGRGQLEEEAPIARDAALWAGPLPAVSLQTADGVITAATEIQDYRAEYAARYVLAHYRENINRDLMAKMVRLSPGYFSNLFRAEAGMSFSDYLIQVRIENAKRLLRRFDLSVEAISRECGFHSLAHFSRTFKDRCRVSPLKYRKNPTPGPLTP